MSTSPTQIQTIPTERLCALTGLTDRRHRQLAEEGFFPPPLAGEYQLNATIAGLFKYFQKDTPRLAREKLRTTIAQRKMAEMKVEEVEAAQSRKWILTEDALQMFRIVVQNLEGLPTRARSEHGLTDAQTAGIQRLIDEARGGVADEIDRMADAAREREKQEANAKRHETPA